MPGPCLANAAPNDPRCWDSIILIEGKSAALVQAGFIFSFYDAEMRRIFQLGTMLLVLAVFLAPVSEMFDRWDAPGLGNDTEMGVFCMVLLLCLVLAACTLMRRLTDRAKDELVPIVWPDEVAAVHPGQAFTCKLVIPPIAAPLRI